jgi:hypothetical protein
MEATRVAKAPLCREFRMHRFVTVIFEAPTEAASAGLLY